MKSQAYELGYAIGKLVGFLLLVGVVIFFVYLGRRKGNKSDNDQTLDL